MACATRKRILIVIYYISVLIITFGSGIKLAQASKVESKEINSDCHTRNMTLFAKENYKLGEQLQQWNEAYRLAGNSPVNDEIYDQLFDKWQRRQRCQNLSDVLSEVNISQQSDLIKHPIPHTGLKKLNETEINTWISSRNEIWLQPKIDGVAVSLVYERGRLVSVISRGNGIEGLNWREKANFIPAIPKKIATQEPLLVLQGEIYWKLANHVQEKYGGMNARNKIAGWLMRKISPIQIENDIDIFIWAWPEGHPKYEIQLGRLTELGFASAEKYSHKIENIAQVKQWREHYYRSQMPFATDGIVLKSFPPPKITAWQPSQNSWAIAWKYPLQSVVSEIKDLQFRVGRTGLVSVVSIIEPIEIDSKIVRKVNVGSLNTWKKKDLLVGDQVQVSLAGHGAPKIENVVWRLKKRQYPDTIKLEQFHFLSCLRYSPDCFQQFTARLTWLGKQIKIKGVSEATWRLWVENYGITQLTTWLSPHWQQQLPNTRKTAQFINQLQVAMSQPLGLWLKGFGIPLKQQQIMKIKSLDMIFNSTFLKDINVSKNQKKKLNQWLGEPEIQKLLKILQEVKQTSH